MDSINKNQPEDNHKDLNGKEAIEKIKAMTDKNGICFFCTDFKEDSNFKTRPMAVQQVDNKGVLWFMSAADSFKNEEIKEDHTVQLLFKGSSYSDFLTINGRASISKDKKKIEELWSPEMKVWFTEGKDDPRVSVIKVVPTDGYYWETKNGMIVSSIKMAIGALTGVTLDDSMEGKIKVKA